MLAARTKDIRKSVVLNTFT